MKDLIRKYNTSLKVRWKKRLVVLGGAAVMAAMLSGCGGGRGEALPEEESFRYGTMAYGPEMGNAGLNPHDNYSGWSTVRYGVGETLFRFSYSMELEPWLAESYEQTDEYTVKINLRDGVYFTSGRKMDGQAVKECLEHLVETHDRAPLDLRISEILAEDNTVTIISEEKVPVLLNYLCDPYGAVIDMEYGVTKDRNVAGTGPYMAVRVSDTEIELEKNPNYWGGEVKTDKILVKAITDGDTLTMALQSGELDAAQGLPYASLPLLAEKEEYVIRSVDTSRTFFAAMNYETEALQDERVRQAIALGIDKRSFTEVLLKGNGTPAAGPFPAGLPFGDDKLLEEGYQPERAMKLLEEAGYVDGDGDGYREKDGERLTLVWLTYPGRQELPLLAEAAQGDLKKIGIDVTIHLTANHLDVIEKGEWDIYASAFVTAPTGDPAYFFTTHALSGSPKNRGKYYSEELENLSRQLDLEFDPEARAGIGVRMQEVILKDHGFLFLSHLKMSFVTKADISGFHPHPSDYYELTADLERNRQ